MTKKEKMFILTYMLILSIGLLTIFIILFNKLAEIHDDTQQTLNDHRNMTCKIEDISTNTEIIIKCYPESIDESLIQKF